MTFAPAPAPAPISRMVLAQTALETRVLLRNGEQLLLIVVIPVAVLALLVAVPVIDTGPGAAVDVLVPGVLALSVMSTAFTSLAIATAYERRYGVLKLLGTSPLPRWGLLAAKALTVLFVEALQVVLVCGLGFALGWRPDGAPIGVATLLILGTVAFAGLALLMAGTLRADVTLAAANLIYVTLLLTGGVIIPLESYPSAIQPLLVLTPAGALAAGLRALLVDGGAIPWAAVGILVVWTVVGFATAARWFRWE